MTIDDRLFSLIRRISAIESQLVTRRSFLGGTDAGAPGTIESCRSCAASWT